MHRPNRVLRQFGMSQNIPISALDVDHLHECSRRGRKNYDWVKHHRLMVDAWEKRHNLIVDSDLVENYSMRYDYETWYDSITRRFISLIEPQKIDYGYQPGDAYFRRIVRDETSNLKNLFGGLSVDDQPCEALAEVVKKTIQTCDLLYEMSFRTPEQQHHHARSSNRRRRLRDDDDVADEQSFSTPDWRQSMSTQSPTTHSWPHSSHVDDSSHGTTTQLLVTLGWASISHGEDTSHGDSVFQAPHHSYSVPSSYANWPNKDSFNVSFGLGTSRTDNEFQTPQQAYERSFTELLFDGHLQQYEEIRPNYNISPISYLGYSHPQSPGQVPLNIDMNESANVRVNVNEEEEVEAPQLVRKSKRIPKPRDCGTGHHLGRKKR
ncbi:uncharacterized protein [Primulina huaijiensis]|uniref:uncharacterized protein n=1 Tax=Primulina huaijiensis TaxID=1492673 RepID=UPI003CC78806